VLGVDGVGWSGNCDMGEVFWVDNGRFCFFVGMSLFFLGIWEGGVRKRR